MHWIWVGLCLGIGLGLAVWLFPYLPFLVGIGFNLAILLAVVSFFIAYPNIFWGIVFFVIVGIGWVWAASKAEGIDPQKRASLLANFGSNLKNRDNGLSERQAASGRIDGADLNKAEPLISEELKYVEDTDGVGRHMPPQPTPAKPYSDWQQELLRFTILLVIVAAVAVAAVALAIVLP